MRPDRRSSAFAAWSTVAVLVAAYAISFVDRQIVALLVEPLKADFRVSDAQIGLLQGPAFGIFYAVLGLPLGWLADRVHRIRLIAFGILLWSAMTAAGGFASSFEWLLVARMGVGVGEAALVPAAVSLLADRFPPARRALPMSVFTAGLSLGAGLALVLGGSFIGYADEGLASLPLIGEWLADRRPWQAVFILAGLVGLPVVFATSLLPEPARASEASGEGSGITGGLRYLRGNLVLFGPLLAGTSLLYLFSNALSAWLPTLFIRGWGWSAGETGLRLGFIIIPCAVLGNLASGFLADHLRRKGRIDAPLCTMLIGAGILAPAAVAAPLLPNPTAALFGVVALYSALALCFGVATAALVAVTPGHLRGQVVAVYLLAGNLIGLGIGPPTIGILLDLILRNPDAVGAAITIMAVLTVAPAVLLLMRSAPAYRGRAAAIEAQSSADI
jgi:MFS family permease